MARMGNGGGDKRVASEGVARAACGGTIRLGE